MSAFIVSNATMQRCVSALRPGYGACEDADKLGRELFALNQKAVNFRYQDSEHIEPEIGDYSDWQWKLSSPVMNGDGMPTDRAAACEWLKALHCLRYQMSEGEEVPASCLYFSVEKKIRHLEHHLATMHPEYESAPWDF